MSADVVPISFAREKREARLHAADEPRLDSQQLCELLSVSPSTLKRWRKAGMPYEPWGPRLYRYQASAVLAWRRRFFGESSA